jgi:hypothetical protein
MTLGSKENYIKALLREVLKAGPLCWQRTLDPKEISAMALNSTRPRRGTSLILYLRVVVMPRCSSRARSLSVRTGASTPKDSTSSASHYIFSSSMSLEGVYSLLALSSTSYSFSCYCSTADEPWAVGLSGATSSISQGSSSCGTFWGALWPTGSRPMLLRVVRRVWAIYHLEREEYETINFLWSQEIRIKLRW